MTPDERDDIERTAREASWWLKKRAIEGGCGFVLTGYAVPLPCLREVHTPTSVHDCGGVLVVAANAA